MACFSLERELCVYESVQSAHARAHAVQALEDSGQCTGGESERDPGPPFSTPLFISLCTGIVYNSQVMLSMNHAFSHTIGKSLCHCAAVIQKHTLPTTA
jgi:hypothetical protein